jgi:hypothetical protein
MWSGSAHERRREREQHGMPVIEGGQVLRGGQDFGGVLGGQVLYGGQEIEPEQGGRTQPDSEAVEMSVGPFRRSGAPPNGWYNGVADKGAIAVDILTGDTYRNTGTKAATVWTADAASGGGSGASVTISATEPDSPADGQPWLRLVEGQAAQLYAWDAGGAFWRQASVGYGATGAPFSDQDTRMVGVLTGDPGDGYFAGLVVELSSNRVRLTYETPDGVVTTQVLLDPDQAYITYSGASSCKVRLSADGVQVQGVPITDPNVQDALWLGPEVDGSRPLLVSSGP